MTLADTGTHLNPKHTLAYRREGDVEGVVWRSPDAVRWEIRTDDETLANGSIVVAAAGDVDRHARLASSLMHACLDSAHDADLRTGIDQLNAEWISLLTYDVGDARCVVAPPEVARLGHMLRGARDQRQRAETFRRWTDSIGRDAGRRMPCDDVEIAPLADAPDLPTVGEFARTWVERRVAQGLRCGASYRSIVNAHLGALKMRLDELTGHDVLVMIHELELRGAAPRTRRNVRNLLRVVMAAAVDEGLVDANPVPRLANVDVDADATWRMDARYTPEECAALATHPEPDHALAWALQAWAGLRISEVAGLRGSDYEPSSGAGLGRLRVQRAYSSNDRTHRETKTRRARLVPVHPRLASMLDARAAGADELVVRVHRTNGTSGPLRNDRADKWIARDCELVGISDRGTHALRASFITALEEADVSEPLVNVLTHGSQQGGRRAIRGYARPTWAKLSEVVLRLPVPRVAPALQLSFPGF
ncbi:MAG: tyrosine-type recombinase/integrase [Deltaproteobacteria bacterium]